MTQIDKTYDPDLKSWFASANGHSSFPLRAMILPTRQTSAASAKYYPATISEFAK
jgi:hypothetical protein